MSYAALLRASSSAYEDFELDTIPVIAEEIGAPSLAPARGGVRPATIAREPGCRVGSCASTGILMASTQGSWRVQKSIRCSQVLSGRDTDEPSLRQLTTSLEDPREALRLERKVDPVAWVQKYLAHRVCPGAEVLSVGWRSGRHFALSRQSGFIHQGNWNRHQQGALGAGEGEKSRQFARAICLRRCAGDGVSVQQFRPGLLPYVAPIPEGEGKSSFGNGEGLQARRHRFAPRPGRTTFCGTTRKIPQSSEPLKKLWRLWRTTGFDPFVGRKLFSMARNAGLTNIDVQAECYHLIVGEADPHILKTVGIEAGDCRAADVPGARQ